MANPFPGMNPYLEPFWTDVHTRMIVYASDQLKGQLPKGLAVHVEQSIMLDADDQDFKPVRPDLHVTETWSPAGQSVIASKAALLEEPEIIHFDDEFPYRHLEIRDIASGGRVVTVIEVISPTNKTSGYSAYKQKQGHYLSSEVNLVEIDLMRTGRPVVWATHQGCDLHRLPPCLVSVHRASNPGRGEIYRLPLEQKLASVRIPLRPGDKDVTLNLQDLLDQCHENGSYDTISYAQDPPCALTDAEHRWLDTRLREQGLR